MNIRQQATHFITFNTINIIYNIKYVFLYESCRHVYKHYGHVYEYRVHEYEYCGHEYEYCGHEYEYRGHEYEYYGHKYEYCGHKYEYCGHEDEYRGHEDEHCGHEYEYRGRYNLIYNLKYFYYIFKFMIMRTIPRRDYDFNVIQEFITQMTVKNSEAWKIDTEWLTTDIMPAKNEWVTAWNKYKDPATRTVVMTFSKNEARKKYEVQLRKLVKYLQSNPLVNNNDLRSMRIVVPSNVRTPAPVPTSYPIATVDSSIMRRLTINFRDSEGFAIAKPKGVHGAEIKWGIDIEYPIDTSMLPNSSFDTRTPFMLEFLNTERGKKVYFCMRWENTVGVKGPWGIIETAIVP